jgi:hypothetical protein
MLTFSRRIVIGSVVGFLVILVVCFWRIYSNAPPSQQSTHRIAAGGSERVIISSKRSGVRRRRPPYSVEFQSSVGAVDVYVVPVSLGYRAQDWEHINTVTAEFAAGQVPKDVVAKESGARGQIKLRDWWESKKTPSYLVLIRSANQTEVTVVVHYGP